MITDKLGNIDIYTNIPQYAKDFIKSLSSDIDIGSYQLKNDDYANVETYTTKNILNARYEKHNRYIDIQILIKGKEKIYYRDSQSLINVEIPYNAEKDIEFYSDNVDGEYIKLDGSNFMMIFPHEAHAPQVSVDSQMEKVLKVVLKIKV